MGLDELLSELGKLKTIYEHPDWPKFKERKLPERVSFYYTNKEGQEAYWDQARIIKLDLRNMLLILEGAHGDPLNFDIFKIAHCKNAKTKESVQEIFFELMRMWRETYEPETSGE
jgi:hypothetical protein